MLPSFIGILFATLFFPYIVRAQDDDSSSDVDTTVLSTAILNNTVTSVIVSSNNATTTNLMLTVNNPVVNQMMIPGQKLVVQYTVNGIPTETSIRQMNYISNYPVSLNLVLRWTQRNNAQTSIQMTALSRLSTRPYIEGLRNQVYSHRWKLPNCHFFKRYMPSDWYFYLDFIPQYPEVDSDVANNGTKKAGVVVPLGPKQTTVTIPINVYFNATVMEGSHHKGC